jgi:His Kinase A (phospho-acceptor) domain
LGRAYRLDIIWVAFVGINLAAMRLLPAWGTVPFLAIWVSLTAIYGLRLWRLQPTILTWAAVTLATGGIIVVQVLKGQQDADYLAEVPLIALMFLVMVWHGRRRIAAMEERLTAMEEVQRISQENLRLLEEQHRFLQDASHELGTPITVVLGHAELMERAASETVLADDARVVAGELRRLGRMASRILLLASAHRSMVTADSSSQHPHPADERGGQVDRGEAGHHASRRVADSQAPRVRVDHLQDLHLHGGERGQAAAQPGTQQRPPVAGQRQPFLQAGDEVAQEERRHDVDRERGPRPRRRRVRERLRQPGPEQGAERTADEDGGQLTAVDAGHAPPGGRRLSRDGGDGQVSGLWPARIGRQVRQRG